MRDTGWDVGIDGETEESRMPPNFLAWAVGKLGSYSQGRSGLGVGAADEVVMLLDLCHHLTQVTWEI